MRDRIWMTWLLTAALGLAACTEQPSAPTEDAGAALEDARVREDVDTLERALPGMLRVHVEREAARQIPALRAAIAEGAQLEALEVRAPEQVRALYARREIVPMWLDEDPERGLNDQGVAWLERLRRVEATHGIFGERLRLPQIEAAYEQLEAVAPAPEIALEPGERAALRDWFADNAARFGQDRDNARLLEELTAPEAPLARLGQLRQRLQARSQARRRARLRLELVLTDALVRLAYQLRWDNLAWQRGQSWSGALADPVVDEGESLDPKIRARLERARAAALMQESLTPLFEERQPVDEAVRALWPPFEQYPRLVEAYGRFQKIEAEGGWDELPHEVVGLEQGDEGEGVRLLKARLRAERMWEGDDTPRFGAALAQAVELYQRTHQIWVKGHITEETWRSMNVPATRRRLRLRRSLQLWRDSRVGPDREYVRVNIPDFHAEIWKDGERQMRVKVVTGSGKREWVDGEVTMPRATRLFSDELEYIVFNPYWNVPKGIVEQEILPELEENPEYLKENHYEWHETSVGNRVLRQLPGEHNALGLVKFLFPNEHDIYMHDTNEKGFFRYPIRAFSHGCVRVHEPFALAEYLLRRQDQWDEERGVERWTGEQTDGGEVWIKLEEPLPVHLEYVVARVDEQGWPHFLADVYRRDHAAMTRTAATSQAYRIAERARRAGGAEPD